VVVDTYNLINKTDEWKQHLLSLTRDTASLATAITGVAATYLPAEAAKYIFSIANTVTFVDDEENTEEAYKRLAWAAMGLSVMCGAYSVYRNQKQIRRHLSEAPNTLNTVQTKASDVASAAFQYTKAKVVNTKQLLDATTGNLHQMVVPMPALSIGMTC
jgi:hypothetical protein